MKFYLLLISFLILIGCKSTKNTADTPDHRLYFHVDSLITQVLNYEYNEDSYLDSASIKVVRHGPSIFLPKNPEPLIVINGIPITKETLKNYSLEDVDEFNVIQDMAAPAIYGSRARNGVIVIKSKAIKP